MSEVWPGAHRAPGVERAVFLSGGPRENPSKPETDFFSVVSHSYLADYNQESFSIFIRSETF